MTALTTEELQVSHDRAAQQIATAHRLGASILTYTHSAYPPNVYDSNNPVPVLYVRGALDVLVSRQAVACVGSRHIRPPYTHYHESFARKAVEAGFTVVSGFALGADSIGHKTAFEKQGRTICVMPGGLERPFPPENKGLWDCLLSYPKAAFVSEFPFGVRAAGLTLRKRNKLIVAFARGVLISQSAFDGGAMNAFRFAREQHKPVATFEEDGTKDTSGNRLIAEEARNEDCVLPGEHFQAHEQWLHWLSSLT